MSKSKILSSVVGLIMLVVIVNKLVGAVLLGCLGAYLWIKGQYLD